MTRAELEWDPDQRSLDNPSFKSIQTLLAQMVGEDRLCTFREMGFEDREKQRYRIGDHLPQVLIVCEKESLGRKLEYLSDKYGVSYIILGGQPSLLATQFLSDRIRELGPLTITANRLERVAASLEELLETR